jgi:GTPase SAR1 family protein
MNLEIGRQILICLEAIKAVVVLVGCLKEKSLRDEFKMKVERMKLDLENQNMMFKKTDFEVAVIGLEKAGKSSLLNSWLKFNLLPSDRTRCTYTIVEIRSCKDENEQKFDFIFKKRTIFLNIIKFIF